eukprot:TRINITY_DN2752_c0_g1_i2.p1 TRINITY_DN2752_c0_g1~~TRINITY_DN2752_c0_g1_i2.p1  ORF type:complete len:486 (-),score=63.95 TRINITY_DN2752_c0_g1_i2:20-1477(-)
MEEYPEPSNKKTKTEIDDTLDPADIIIYQDAILGSGCFGKVLKGRLGGTDVAIKVLFPQYCSKVVLSKEVKIMSTLKHPNILLYMGSCPDKYAIVMECMKCSLSKYLHENEISWNKKLQFGIDITRGMAWLAKRNFIHCDLKPENVLLDNNLTCKISDFGLSRIVPNRTHSNNHPVGSILWRAPEILLRKDSPVDTKLDVYAFSLVFWEILTQQYLWPEYTDQMKFIADIAMKGIRPSLADLKELHPELLAVLTTSWDAEPSNRHHFEQLVEILEDLIVEINLPSAVFPQQKDFWKEHFKSQVKVPLATFEAVHNPYVKAKTSTQQLVLSRVLGEDSPFEGKVVTIERFRAFYCWFGSATPLIDYVISVVGSEWFFGALSATEADNFLKNHNPGTFLVRFNKGEKCPVETAPFTISMVIDTKSTVQNSRVFLTEEGYQVTIGEVPFTAPTLVSLVEQIRAGNSIVTIAPGWPFRDIFHGTKPKPY